MALFACKMKSIEPELQSAFIRGCCVPRQPGPTVFRMDSGLLFAEAVATVLVHLLANEPVRGTVEQLLWILHLWHVVVLCQPDARVDAQCEEECTTDDAHVGVGKAEGAGLGP